MYVDNRTGGAVLLSATADDIHRADVAFAAKTGMDVYLDPLVGCIVAGAYGYRDKKRSAR